MAGVTLATRARTSLAHASASWRRAHSFRACATMEVSDVRGSTMGDRTVKLRPGSGLRITAARSHRQAHRREPVIEGTTVALASYDSATFPYLAAILARKSRSKSASGMISTGPRSRPR